MATKEQKGWRALYDTAPSRGSVQPSAEGEGDRSQNQRSIQKEEKFKAGKDILLHNSSSVGGWEKEKGEAENRKN